MVMVLKMGVNGGAARQRKGRNTAGISSHQGAAAVCCGVKRTWKDDELTGVLSLSLQQKIQMYVIAP